MAVQCPDCGGAHPKWDCGATDAKKASWRAHKESLAKATEGKTVPSIAPRTDRVVSRPSNVAEALQDAPVSTVSAAIKSKGGRPITATSDRAKYMREKMRQLRRDHPEKYARHRNKKV